MIRKSTVYSVVPLALVLLFSVFSLAQLVTTGPVSAVRPLPDGIEFHSGTVLVRATALSPDVIRLRYSVEKTFPPDHSFAVVAHPDLQKPASLKFVAEKGTHGFDTGTVRLRVDDATGRISMLDAAGSVILQDRPGMPALWRGSEFRIYKSMPRLEQYFGLGDKADSSDHRGNAFTMWTTDAYGWQQGSDPLYKSIPFFLGLNNGRAYGVFFDNTNKTSFDFGKESPDYFSFGSVGGELNYYFIAGPEPKQVVSRYTTLTGRTPLPPLFALGFQQSRYSYYPEARVLQVAQEFRDRKSPADVLYLDIDYQDGYRPFTISRKNFPNFEQMVKTLADENFKVVVISDLHIKKEVGYKPYDEGAAADLFVKNPDGSQYVGNVWPGPSVFPEFTLSTARKWYGSQFKLFTDAGIAGIWNDMNEPAVFRYPDKSFPITTVHRVDSETENRIPAGPIRTTDHREIHNVFGSENVHATYDGLLQLRPNERPFVLTRAAFAGAQRWAATWTGDNQSTWEHYRLSLPTLLNLSVSGYGFVGNDVGGFGGSPTPDLLTRWIELGAFFPMFRDHTSSGTLDQEPWVHGPEQESIRRQYIDARYRLLPYIYTSFDEMSRTGVPVMRAFFLEHPAESHIRDINDQEFFFGPDLLVAPKLTEMLDAYDVILPEGTWYNYWTGEKVEAKSLAAWDAAADAEAPKPPQVLRISVAPALNQLPVFVRGGAIIPHQPLVQSTAEKPNGPLEIRVYPGPNCSGSVYTDDGHTFDYKQGHYFRQSFTCEVTPQGVTVKLAKPEGDFTPWWTQIRVTLIGQPGSVYRDLPFSRDAQSITLKASD